MSYSKQEKWQFWKKWKVWNEYRAKISLLFDSAEQRSRNDKLKENTVLQ